MENLFILICVAADDTKSKTDRQREREENKRQKTPPLSGCAHCGTVGWAQHRKRANKLYISNFMNSCWNGKRNGSRRGREREIGRGRQGTVARIDQFTNSTLNVQRQKQKHRQQRAYSLQQKTTTDAAAEAAAETAAALATAHKKKQFVTNGGERQNASKNRAQEKKRESERNVTKVYRQTKRAISAFRLATCFAIGTQ